MSLPRHFECPEESDTPEDRQTQGWHDLMEGEDHFQQTAEDYEEIKPIEERDKVALKQLRSWSVVRSHTDCLVVRSLPGSPGHTSSAASPE